MNRIPLAVVLSSGLLLVACDSESGMVGRWEPLDTENPMALEFRADSTFTLYTGEFSGEGSYVLENDGTLVLRPTGTLATVIPAGFDGTVVQDSMNLCAPSGVCTDFFRED